MRILFVSDTHLGIDLPVRPRVERRRRGPDFFRGFELALAPALAGEVDVVVHGGDLHFRSRVPAWLADAALAPLRRIAGRGIPVLLVPGNHERAGLPYPLLAVHEHLHVFHAPRTVHLEAGGLRVAFSGFPYAAGVRARFPGLLAAARRDERGADARVLCLHQCVEGATCGPGDFTFRDGDDVIRRSDLPAELSLVLAGHVHRHQVLASPGRPTVVYAGSVERTSFVEAGEAKGSVVVELDGRGPPAIAFRALPARPMLIRRLVVAGVAVSAARARIQAVIGATPVDAVLRLQVEGAVPPEVEPLLSAPALRAMGGERVVSWRPGQPGSGGPHRPVRAGSAPANARILCTMPGVSR